MNSLFHRGLSKSSPEAPDAPPEPALAPPPPSPPQPAGQRPARPGEGPAVRDPHGSAAEPVQVLAGQVPHAKQADRRRLPHHLPARLRPLQPRLLVDLPPPGGRKGLKIRY